MARERKDVVDFSDHEVLALIKGDRSQAEILLSRCQRLVFPFVYKILKHREEAEDATQETLAKIYLKASTFKKQEGAGFRDWVYRIAFNTAISHYRYCKRLYERENPPADFCEFSDDRTGSPSLDLEELELRLSVRELVAQLPEDLQIVVTLHYFEDKSYEAIACEESISLPALKMRLFRARKTLKEISWWSC